MEHITTKFTQSIKRLPVQIVKIKKYIQLIKKYIQSLLT